MHELQLVNASSSSFIITSDNDLLLLYSERQELPTWILLFEDSGIEAIQSKQSAWEQRHLVLHTDHSPVTRMSHRSIIISYQVTSLAYQMNDDSLVMPLRSLHDEVDAVRFIVRDFYLARTRKEHIRKRAFKQQIGERRSGTMARYGDQASLNWDLARIHLVD